MGSPLVVLLLLAQRLPVIAAVARRVPHSSPRLATSLPRASAGDDSLLPLLGVDVASAVTSSALLSPFVTVIDKSIVMAAAGMLSPMGRCGRRASHTAQKLTRRMDAATLACLRSAAEAEYMRVSFSEDIWGGRMLPSGLFASHCAWVVCVDWIAAAFACVAALGVHACATLSFRRFREHVVMEPPYFVARPLT